MSKTDVIIICAFYLIFMFAIGGFHWVNFAKVRVVTNTIRPIGNEDQKEIKEIKLEQLELIIMVVETFALLIVKTIGQKNIWTEQLTTLAD